MVVAIVAALAFSAALLVGPAQRYFDAQARLGVLELKDEVLHAEIARLEGRIDDLHDPARIELIAREQHGFVRPGELAYTIVPPDAERQQIVPSVEIAAPEPPWYVRWWDSVRGLLDGES